VKITVSKENYLKAIAEAESEGEPVIPATLARWLNVSAPAVTMALKRLKRDALIRTGRDGTLSLTSAGRDIANRLLNRHHLIERMLTEMFVKSAYEGGRLDVLLPPGKALIERIDALGRSGHVSESVVRYQNNEMAKADVAFEVLSRYFARQIVDILDATDPGDRDIREREMRGLEQFFGMGIADKAQVVAGGGSAAGGGWASAANFSLVKAT